MAPEQTPNCINACGLVWEPVAGKTPAHLLSSVTGAFLDEIHRCFDGKSERSATRDV